MKSIRTLKVFLIPVAEMILANFLKPSDQVNQLVNFALKSGYFQLTAFPAVITLYIFISHLDKKNDPLPVALQKKILSAHLLLAGLFLLTTVCLPAVSSLVQGAGLLLLWYGLGCLTLISSFFIFINPSDFFLKLKMNLPEALLGAVAAGSLGVYIVIDHFIWPFLVLPTTFIIFHLLRLTGLGMIPDANPMILKHPLFRAEILSACSGLEGIAIFVFIMSLILMTEWGRYSAKKILAIYAAGILYMFVLNIVRISAFFAAAIWATQKWGEEKAGRLFISLFHENAGWIFYIAGIGIFLFFLFRLDNRKNSR